MKKALTPILAVVAVIAIVCACVFGSQSNSKQADLNTANDSIKALEAEKAQLSADLETAKSDLKAKADELDTAKADLEAKTGELDTAKADLEAKAGELDTAKADLAAKAELETKVAELEGKVTELEGKLAKTERALTAAKSNAYIMFANADWSVQNWGTADSEDEKVKVTPAAVTGPGDYTVGLEFAEPVSGLAFTALGVKNGEIDLPGYFLRVNEIRINGKKIDWKKELSAKIISLQKKDGSWANDNNRFWENDPVLATSFAILALALCY
jgi:outer membrane murein-binding lipoprotein Lpp